MINRFILGLTALLASCTQPAPPPAPGPVTFTIGNPYQTGNEWHYPHDFNSYDATGLSTVIDPSQAAAYTADNEPFDANALAAASPVLQLPCVVTITNLVTGNSVDVRVNDRGPASAGRIIAVTPRVAQLLNYPGGGVVEVEVKLNQALSMQLAGAAGDGPKLTAAPVASITAQSLAPGGGAAGASQQLGPAAQSAAPGQSVTLPGTVTPGIPAPGPLYVQIPGFGAQDDAFRAMARIPPDMDAHVTPVEGQDRPYWAVNIGPYHSVQDADQALQAVLQNGIVDPEIIVR